MTQAQGLVAQWLQAKQGLPCPLRELAALQAQPSQCLLAVPRLEAQQGRCPPLAWPEPPA